MATRQQHGVQCCDAVWPTVIITVMIDLFDMTHFLVAQSLRCRWGYSTGRTCGRNPGQQYVAGTSTIRPGGRRAVWGLWIWIWWWWRRWWRRVGLEGVRHYQTLQQHEPTRPQLTGRKWKTRVFLEPLYHFGLLLNAQPYLYLLFTVK